MLSAKRVNKTGQILHKLITDGRQSRSDGLIMLFGGANETLWSEPTRVIELSRCAAPCGNNKESAKRTRETTGIECE